MFNLPVSRMATSEISALGAAMDAAVGTGMHATFEDAVAAMVRKGKSFQPDAQNHRVYTQLFNDVYKKSSRILEPLYSRIARITRYPDED